ncbi:MAG: LPXTG cell wall anchor domain-containing protein [Actinomycetota bacterium]|nr:LPXTG cell wall anchor domain-containing protein [Actinomycetota bacterium]
MFTTSNKALFYWLILIAVITLIVLAVWFTIRRRRQR